jgi:hypothetical protein
METVFTVSSSCSFCNIEATVPWRAQNDTAANVWYTAKGSQVYAIALSWPSNNLLVLTQPKPSSRTSIVMLGYGPVKYTTNSYGSITIILPALTLGQLPNPHGWAFALSNVL